MRIPAALLAIALIVSMITPAIADAPNPAVVVRSGVVSGPGDPDAMDEGGLAIVRFDRPVDGGHRDLLRVAGVEFFSPLGDQGFLVDLPAGAFGVVATIPGVSWVAPFEPQLRIAPEIAAIRGDSDRIVPVTVHLTPGVDLDRIAARLSALGQAVVGRSDGAPSSSRATSATARMVLTPTERALAAVRDEIAAWPETVWIGRRPAYRLLNDDSAWVGQSGLDGGMATPVYDHGLFGEGQVIGVLDTGLDADMCYFRDDSPGLPPTVVGFGVGTPDPNQRKVRIVDFLAPGEDPVDPAAWDTHDHGSHVAGTILGDNFATPGRRDSGDGMAPAATLVMQDGGYGTDNCADMPALGCPAASLIPFFEQAYLQGARIHSNSYGDRENFTPHNIYSDGSEDADAFMWDHPDFLLVFAAGNSGSGLDTVASPASAKNVLAVGATLHDDRAGTLASFSSRGNTHDGRWKPDITAPGSDVISADNDKDITSDNCGTRSMSGTSMACPTAAGLAALVREYYEKGYYPAGAPNAPDGFAPSAALLKATLIVGAVAMEDLADSPPEPNQGWGRIKLEDSLFFPGHYKRVFAVDVMDGFESPTAPADIYSLEVLDGAEPLRVAVAWTDYPSTPAASINLVNDLDLEIESPGGEVYLGNVFSGGISVPAGSPDRRNNVEVVRIENPEVGTWTIRVVPHAVPQPSQGYGLVATGPIPVPGVFLDRDAIRLDDSVGGDNDGVLEPGEWVDLPLTLINRGDTTATNAYAAVESLSPYVEIVNDTAGLGDVASGGQVSTAEPHLRVRITTDLPCKEVVSLRFHYGADGVARSEDVAFDTGLRAALLTEDFESPTGWSHVASESTATGGDWIVDDPVGTDYQSEDDASAAPGTRCLFTAQNPSGSPGTEDIDAGVVVARSGAYDLAGHPEARVSLQRWYALSDVGVDDGDFYRLEIRESAQSPDVILEEIGNDVSVPDWTEVTFRIADFVAPGPAVELKVSAADGPDGAGIVEAAIDEVVFWEPACDPYDPAPNSVSTLTVGLVAADVRLGWARPTLDPSHGEASRYRVYRSSTPSGGFLQRAEFDDTSSALTWDDAGAAAGGTLYYEVVAANAAGDSDPAP